MKDESEVSHVGWLFCFTSGQFLLNYFMPKSFFLAINYKLREDYLFLISISCTQLHDFKYSYLMQIINIHLCFQAFQAIMFSRN